jgi:hypothetical protein
VIRPGKYTVNWISKRAQTNIPYGLWTEKAGKNLNHLKEINLVSNLRLQVDFMVEVVTYSANTRES